MTIISKFKVNSKKTSGHFSRRSFLKVSSFATLFAGTFSGFFSKKALAGSPPRPGTRYQNSMLRALAETAVPGPESDPTGAPGAIEARTTEFVERFDDAKLLPVGLGLINALLTMGFDVSAFFRFGRGFGHLPLNERTEVVRGLSGIIGVPIVMRLLRAPFYTATENDVGYRYVGYPGPNNGFEDFSFRERTANGHPRAIRGNLP